MDLLGCTKTLQRQYSLLFLNTGSQTTHTCEKYKTSTTQFNVSQDSCSVVACAKYSVAQSVLSVSHSQDPQYTSTGRGVELG